MGYAKKTSFRFTYLRSLPWPTDSNHSGILGISAMQSNCRKLHADRSRGFESAGARQAPGMWLQFERRVRRVNACTAYRLDLLRYEEALESCVT